MASLQLVKGSYHISFRFNGRRFKRSLKTAEIARADARRIRLEETIGLVETRLFGSLPDQQPPTS
jgi:hypothetical protein